MKKSLLKVSSISLVSFMVFLSNKWYAAVYRWNIDWDVVVGMIFFAIIIWIWIIFLSFLKNIIKNNKLFMHFFWKKKTFYENWNIKEEYWINEDWTKNWEYASYYEWGEIKEECYYVNWKIEWDYISYYTDGWVKEFCKYVNWKKEWKFIRYQQDAISPEIARYMINHHQHTEYECYYENWVLMWPYMDYYDSFLSFDEKDFKKGEYNYVRWILEWDFIKYYKSGAIMGKWFYKNWKMQWQYFEYHENGQLSCIYNLLDWKIIDWEFVSYHDNGQIANKCNYKNWELVWKYVEYDEDGWIMFEWDFTKWECVIYDKMADGKRYLRDIENGGYIWLWSKKYNKEEYQKIMLRERQTNHRLVHDIYFSYNPMEEKKEKYRKTK